MTTLQITSADEVQLLSEKPVLRQIYDAQVGGLGLDVENMLCFVMRILPIGHECEQDAVLCDLSTCHVA